MLVHEAMEAAKTLEAEGISVRVINVSTIKPLDGPTILKAAQETKFIVTCEEHSVIGGLGGAISEFLGETHPTLIKKLGIYDQFGQSGTGSQLLDEYGLRAKDIVAKVKENM
jgi:transketolase